MARNPYVTKKFLRLYEEEFSPNAISEQHSIDIDKILDFSLNVNPFGPPTLSTEAAQKVLSQCGQYPDLHLGKLRTKVAQKHCVAENMLLFGAGLDEILKLIVQAWTAPGDHVVIHIPTFPRYELESQLHGLHPILVTSPDPWEVDITCLYEALERYNPAIGFICTPNNPTGAIFSHKKIDQLACDFPNTIFVIDEALIDPAEEGTIDIVRKRKNVAVLRTFSKYYGIAGYRVGYVIADQEIISNLSIVRPPFNVSLVSAAAAIAALDDIEFLNSSREFFHVESEYLCRELNKIQGCNVRGNYSNMILLELEEISSESFCHNLARQGIIVADGKSFKGLESKNTVRISIKDRDKNTILLNAIKHVMLDA